MVSPFVLSYNITTFYVKCSCYEDLFMNGCALNLIQPFTKPN